MSTETRSRSVTRPMTQITRIAAAVDNHAQGHDAAVLAGAITKAVSGDCMLIAIEPDLSLVMPYADLTEVRHQSERLLATLRDQLSPGARIAVDCDRSVPRGIERIVKREHRQLLVIGSGRDASAGQVRIGRITRQLLHDLTCPVAIAPQGLASREGYALRRVAVGYDGGLHSELALALARQIAAGAGAELVVRGIVEDEVPSLGWSTSWLEPMFDEWNESVEREVASLEGRIADALSAVKMPAHGEVTRGSAADALIALSSEVDLMVIGSRRWGAVARLLLGGTGEALARASHAPLLVVPAPDQQQSP